MAALSMRYLPGFLSLLLAAPAMGGIRLDFNRNNQTYDWLTAFNHSIVNDKFKFNVSFNGESNLIKGALSRWQENATAGFDSERRIFNKLSLTTAAEYTVNGLDKRRVRTSELAAGLCYRPKTFIEIRPMMRGDRKKRSEFENQLNDQGLGYGIRGTVSPGLIHGIDLDASLSYDKVNLTNIPSDEGNGSLRAVSNFWEKDTLLVSLRGLEAAKKYYGGIASPTNVVKQIKQEREGNVLLALSLPASLQVRVDANAHLSRYLYRYTDIEETTAPQRDNYGRGGGYRLGFGSQFGDFASGFIFYRWNTANQDYQGFDLDQKTNLGELTLQTRVRMSSSDSLAADAVFGVTSYSNPNIGSNRQDRDQKTMMINGRISHVFSRFLAAGMTGGVNSFHQIYVSGAQSANNGRNDTYILTPSVRWSPASRFSLGQSFDIQANYITFDYDRKKLATRNRIFRRATSRTDFRLALSDRLAWEQAYTYRYEDYGQLIWDDGWQQAVSWDRRRSGIETRLIFRPDKIFQVSPFFGWEKFGDYSHEVDTKSDGNALQEIRYLSDEQVKLLLEVELIFRWTEARSLRADLSRRIRKFMVRPREINDYVTLTMEYLF